VEGCYRLKITAPARTFIQKAGGNDWLMNELHMSTLEVMSVLLNKIGGEGVLPVKKCADIHRYLYSSTFELLIS
jgi:hypothetical protein